MKRRAPTFARRWRRVFGVGLAAVLVVALAGALTLAFTPVGLRVTDHLVRRVLPGALTGTITGTLAGRVHIRELSYRDDALTVHVASAEVAWQVTGKGLELTLTADGVAITTAKQPAQAPTPTPTLTLPTIALPLPLHRAHFRVGDLRINGSEPALSVAGTLAMTASRLQIADLSVAAGEQRVQARGWLETRGDYPLDLQLEQSLVYAPAAGDPQTVTGASHISGDLAHLRIVQELAGALRAQLDGEVLDALGELRWQAQMALAPTALAPLAPALGPLVASAKLTGSGTLDSLSAAASYRLSGLSLRDDAGNETELGAIDGRLDATLAVRLVTLNALDINHADTGTRVTASGSFDLDSRALALTARWRGERIPRGAADPLPLATEGEVSGRGSLDDYAFDGHGKLAVAGYPEATISIRGTGTQQGVAIGAARFSTKDSRADAQGTLAWAPDLRGDLAVELTDIDPGLLLPEWPGRLSGQAHLSGTLADGRRSATLALPRLSGTLRGFAVAAEGTASIADDQVEIGKFTVHSGQSKVVASGQIKDDWDLRLAVHSPDLAELLPAAGGRLSGDVRVSGAREHPRASVDLDAGALHYANYRLASLKLAADLDTAAAGRVDVKATALGLHVAAADGAARSEATRELQRLEIGIAGTRAQHRVTARAQTSDARIALGGRGGLDPDYRWTGELDELTLSQPAAGEWRLRAPAPVVAGAAQVELGALCLTATSGTGSLCAEGAWRADNWRGTVDISALPFSLFAPLGPENLALTGTLSGHAEAAGSAAGLTSGNGELTTSAGEVDLGKGAAPIRFEPGVANFALDGAGLNAAIDLRLGAAGGLRGRVALPGWRGGDFAPHQAVTGDAHINLTALAVMNAIDTGTANISGALTGDLQLAGTLGAPRLSGEMALKDGNVEVSELGIRLRDIHLALAAAADGNIGIEGALRSGDGTLRIAGNLRADPAVGWPLDLTATGADLLVIDTPEAVATASPQLTLKTTGEGIQLNGDIGIPKARLTPRKLPESAVKVSADAVILPREGQATASPTPPPLQVHSALRIILGDEVKFDGLGLRGRLAGTLAIDDTPGKPSRASGAITIHDGVYEAYGQNLNISQGRLLFAGPMDNPGLDIRAARTVDTVTAGITATGTAKDPQIRLFSTPPMAESDALAYLLLGRPLNQTSGSDGNLLMAAASGMGLSKGEDIAQSIGRSLGLDEVRLSASGDAGAVGLTVGRYLSPKLYVRYLAGAFGAAGALQLRYRLRPHLELQTESGDRAGGDLFYSIER